MLILLSPIKKNVKCPRGLPSNHLGRLSVVAPRGQSELRFLGVPFLEPNGSWV